MSFPEKAKDWLALIETLEQSYMGWIVVASVLTILLSMLLLPLLVAQIPEDYFTRPENPVRHWREFTVFHLMILITRNVIGLVFVLVGFLMLFLPGQGLLTLVAGLALMVFPGKRRLEIWLIKRPGVYKAINWLRKKFAKGPLQKPN